MKRIALILTLAGVANLSADFSYEQTTTITGGAMAGMMRTFSKQAREPIKTTIAVKGDRMTTTTMNTGQVIDLDKETITHIDFQKKTYSVLTFAQFAEQLNQMSKGRGERGQEGGEMTFKPSVKETGQKRTVAGLDAHQVILTVEMQGTDKKTGSQSTFMALTSDMWVAANVAGYDEVRNFYKRMMAKMNWSPNMSSMMAPGSAKGMAEMYKQMSQLDGVPVYSVTKMGGQPGADAAGAGAEPTPQKPQDQNADADKSSSGGALGKLAGGRLGGLGGFGRKKKQDDQPAAADSSAQGGQGLAGSASLMELTTEMSGFSSNPVDPSKFEVPAGFKQVESDLRKR
jgi:hypothetical protein